VPAAADQHAGSIRGADRYEAVDDLWLITTLFQPSGYRSRARNYEVFSAPVRRGGLRMLTIECAFGDAPFSLPRSPDVVSVRARHVLWQKERLLNLALSRLPSGWTKVAWVDADVLFANPRWAVEASRQLDRVAIVQPFERWHLLPEGAAATTPSSAARASFAADCLRDPALALSNASCRVGGTGFAWAARRELIEGIGFYDRCVVGGADHLMAHAVFAASADCFETRLGDPHRRHFAGWSARFSQAARGSIGCVDGDLLHLWHGPLEERDYVRRHQRLAELGYDPATDVRSGRGGCLEWSGDKEPLRRWVESYFARRREGESSDAQGAAR
jgi:hypothetical protein